MLATLAGSGSTPPWVSLFPMKVTDGDSVQQNYPRAASSFGRGQCQRLCVAIPIHANIIGDVSYSA